MRSSPKGSAERLTTPAEHFAVTKAILSEAISDRDAPLLARANIRMNSDRFEEMTPEQQRELTFLFGRAVTAVRGWGAP